ncbi:MAG: sigma-70 family RNA polymerase sigma factor [Maricaulaceae bacterium]|jgi:RNA polymerase sigma-70 factor (ECF subfamily)
MTDEQLVALVIATKDRDAFGELVRRHQAVVRRMLVRLAPERSLADDIAQDAFIRAFRRIETFDGRGPFKNWMCRVAYTEFLQTERRRRAADRTRESARNEAEVQPMSVGGREGGDSIDLERALGELNEAERAAVILCFVAGFSHAEAAEAMNVPIGTVKSRVARGRDKLRSYLMVSETACV